MSSNSKLPQYYIPSQNKAAPKQKQNTTKNIIINWLFQMDYEERIKTFSLVNYDICNLIIKIFEKYSSSSRLKFRINLKEKKPTVTQNENSEDPITSSDNYKVNQKMFLKEIRFYKILKSNDAMTISHNLLSDKDLFIFFFDELSNKKFLSELCPVLYDQKQGVYTCSSPKWIEEKGYYTISQIIIGYFENILNIKYVLSKKKKNDMNDSSNGFFHKRSAVLDLIKNSSYKENLYDMIDLKKIISDVINDKQLINDEERRLASKKFLLGVYKPFKMFEPPVEYNVNSYYYKYKEMLMEKNEELLDNLIFFSFEGQSAIDRHIKEKIMEGFYKYSEDKKLQNVLNEIKNPGFLTNTKKKVRRKKKKNKKVENEKNDENNDDEDGKYEMNNNINIIFDKSPNNNQIFEINNIENIENKGQRKIEKESIEEKKINEENNENNISTISNSSHNNKDNIQEIKNEIVNEELNNKKEKKENNIIEDNNSINKEKDSSKQEDQKSEKESEDNITEESPVVKSDEKEENNNIINNQNNQVQTQKKKKRKKNKKKNYRLTEEELNQIYSSFYNENNNFTNQNKNIKIKNSTIQITNPTSETSAILHNLIISFEKTINKKISSLHEIKYNSIVFLCQKIKDHFKCGISIVIYGSYSTGLELEESDIDISVEFIPNANGKFPNNINLKSCSDLINELNEYLTNFPEFTNLFPIPNTQIPILKMKIKSENNIETKIDLTFNLKNTKNTIYFYNSTLKKYRQIKPLTLLIKNLVKKNNLASVFDGGFSSHSIFIMVTASVRVLLKNKNSLNLGDLLNGFLHFYGKCFNFTNTAIDITDKNNPYIIIQEFGDVPVFVDPITKKNVSKSSHKHNLLKQLFSDTYDKLVQGENNLNKTFEDIFL
jgi:DNA polymerase sigma